MINLDDFQSQFTLIPANMTSTSSFFEYTFLGTKIVGNLSVPTANGCPTILK